MRHEIPAAPDPVVVARVQAMSHARSTARSWNVDLKNRQVFIRRSSIWQNTDEAGAVTPTFPFLMQGSGSTGTALKLYLLLLWRAGAPGGTDPRQRRDAHIPQLLGEHTAWFEYEEVADLMLIPGFEDRSSNSGHRLIRSTLRRLRDDDLIELHDDAKSVRLLAETRSGAAYTHPGSTYADSKRAEDLWVALPPDFFTRGWFTALPPQAILALLVHLWHWTKGRPRPHSFNSEALSRYAPVSKSTMTRGEQLLTHWSVLTMTDRRYPGPGYRSRHRYQLQMDRLKRDCPDEVPPTFR